jgi:hypothetical protein
MRDDIDNLILWATAYVMIHLKTITHLLSVIFRILSQL